MDTPLGRTAGNALEWRSRSRYSRRRTGRHRRTHACACPRDARRVWSDWWQGSGRRYCRRSAMDSWNAMIRAQGGDQLHRCRCAAPPQRRGNFFRPGRPHGRACVGVAAWAWAPAGHARRCGVVRCGRADAREARRCRRRSSPLFTLHADDEARSIVHSTTYSGGRHCATDAPWSKPSLVIERVGA